MNKSCHPVHLCYYMAKFGPIHLAPRYQKLFPQLLDEMGNFAKFNQRQVDIILGWSNEKEEVVKSLAHSDPEQCFLHYDRDFTGIESYIEQFSKKFRSSKVYCQSYLVSFESGWCDPVRNCLRNTRRTGQISSRVSCLSDPARKVHSKTIRSDYPVQYAKLCVGSLPS